MMSKNILLILILASLISCANLSKNFVKKGEFTLRGGVFQNLKWNDSLVFDRYSWFHEATLLYDIMITKIDQKSPFYDWLSKDEKERLGKCDASYIAISYSLDSGKISKKMMENDAKRSGYQRISLTHFKQQFKAHADEFSAEFYDIAGLCYRGDLRNRENILIRFPGFNEVSIK